MTFLRRAAIGLVAATLLLFVAGYALVNGKALPKLTNFNPGVFALDYGAARWKPPLGVEVEQLDLQVQSDGYRLWIRADAASGTFEPASMLKQRVTFTDITASGVSVRLRFPKPAEGTPDDRLPPMDALAPPSEPKPGPSFSVRLRELRDVRVREVWVDGYRYEGELDVSGGFTLVPLTTVQIDPSSVVIDAGTLTMPNGLVARFEPSAVAGVVREVSIVQTLTPGALRQVDATATLAFQAPNLNLLNTLLLQSAPDVRVLYGAGGVRMNVAVDAGVVLDGSEVHLDQRRLGFRVPHFDIIGLAALELAAKDGRIAANATIPGFELDARDSDRQVATGKNFVVRATAGSNDLTDSVRDVDLALKLEEARAPSLTFLGEFIPEGTGIVISGGSGKLTADATLSTRTQRAKGTLGIIGTNVELKNRGAHVMGALEVNAVMDEFNLRTRELSLGGSELKLTDVLVSTPLHAYQSVWLTALATEARFSPKQRHAWHAKLGVSARNLQPLLAVVSGNLKIPKWVVGSLDLPSVGARVELDVIDKDVHFDPLTVRTDGLSVEARVVLTEMADKNLEPHGVGLLRLGAFSAGMVIDGGVITPVLLAGPEWYSAQLDAGSPSP